MTSTLSPLAQACSGSIAAVCSNALIYPLDLVTSRMQTASRGSGKGPQGKGANRGSYDSLFSAIRRILKEEGPLAFYRGLVPDSLSTALSNFLYFYAYSFLRTQLMKKRIKSAPPAPPVKKGQNGSGKDVQPILTAVEELLIGCLAGVIAKAVVSPLSNITVRAQTSSTASIKPSEEIGGKLPSTGVEQGGAKKADDDSDDDEGDYGKAPSSLEIARDILEEKGWTGFWSGFKSSIILTTNPAITFYLFDLFKRLLIPAKHQDHPSPLQTFVTSAVASSIASSVTYPLILAKTRLQFKSPSGRRLYRSNYDVFRKTIKGRQGYKGMYAGLEGQLWKGCLGEGVKMTIKDRLELAIVFAHNMLVRQKRLKAEA